MIKKYKKRPYYFKQIKPFIGKNIIKVLVGQRRVGKSYLFYQLMDEIKRLDPRANIIYVDKESYEFDAIKTYHDLLDFINEKKDKRHKNYVFVDEVQEISQFQRAFRSLHSHRQFDLYCSGSNAELLSGDLATYLSGRYVEFTIHSLSYKEFLNFHQLANNQTSLQKYIKYGGMPYLKNLDLNDELGFTYLENIYNTVVLKDVVARFNIRNVHFLDSLIEFLADNIGSLVSAKKISDFLKSQNVQITPNTVLNYLSYLGSSFLIYKVARKDVRGKKIFEIGEKYYFEDLGLRHSLIGFRSGDINQILENIVFIELLRQGYKVFVGQLGEKEIDFVGEKQGKKLYIQVAYQIPNQKVMQREFGNLLEIQDNYPKLVISMDESTQGDYRGVKHISITDFLLG